MEELIAKNFARKYIELLKLEIMNRLGFLIIGQISERGTLKVLIYNKFDKPSYKKDARYK